MLLSSQTNKNKGYTLIEILVAITIVGIVFAAVFSIFSMVIRSSAVSEARTTATGLANQQMEMIHNLPYNDIATTGGWPQGDIPSTQTKTLNNVTYTIDTEVNYFDDPYDDLVPVDTLGSDYKKIKVEVTWDKYTSGTPVTLYSDISPQGVEESAQPGGVLSILVFDHVSSQPVPNASIQVDNDNLGIHFSGTTDNDGKRLFYSLTPDSDTNYAIQITKSGYTQDYTSEITTELPDPDNPHKTVLEGQITPVSFIIDLVSTLTIHTQDNEATPAPLANIPLTIVGERRLGLDGENEPVPRNKFEGQTTDTNGQLTLTDIEWDNYTITEEDASYDIAEVDPYGPPTPLSPNETQTVTLTLVNHADHTLRATILDNDDNPISGADVRLHGNGFDETQQSSAVGQVFFTPLQLLTYTLEVSKAGYVTFTDPTEISGQTLREVVLATQS